MSYGAGIGAAALAAGACSESVDRSKTFSYTFWGTGAEKKAVSAVINDFAERNDLEGRPQNIPEQYETKLNTLLAGNNPPDAGYLTDGMAMRLGEQGRIVNALEIEGIDRLIPSTLRYYAPDKAVSQLTIEAFALWYDTDAAAEAGVTIPATVDEAWTWDDYVAAADALTADTSGRRPSDSGFNAEDVARYGTTAPSNLNLLYPLMKSHGVDLFDAEGTKTNIDSPEAIEVLQAIQDLIFVHRVAPNSVEAESIGANTSLQLANGRVAMTLDGQWVLPDLAAAEDLNYGVGVLPRFEQYQTMTVSGANGIFTSSPHKEIAKELLLEMGDPAKVDLYAGGLWMPPLMEYYTDDALIASWTDNEVHPEGYRTAVMEPMLNNSIPLPSYELKNFSEIEGAFNGSLPQFFSEQVDVAETAAELAAQVNPLMQGVYEGSPS